MTWGDDTGCRRHDSLDHARFARDIYVHYTMPLGLHHLIGGDHYAPMPENADPRRTDWSAATITVPTPAASASIARATERRSINIAPLSRMVERTRDHAGRPPALVPPPAMGLPHAFRPHACPGHRRVDNRGVLEAQALERRWTTLKDHVDDERFAAVSTKLHRQARDAADWRAKCVAFFENARAGAGK